MKILHFCAGLEPWNGMANTACEFAAEEKARGDDSVVTNDLAAISHGVDEVCIHGAWLPLLWKAAKRAKAVGAKLVIRPAGSYDPVRLAYHSWKKRLVAPFERRMLQKADVVLATCEAEREWVRAYEPRAKSIELTDLKRFFKLEHFGKTGQTYFPKNRPLHLLYLGRRHPLKGVEYLEAAVAELNSSTPPLTTPPLLKIVSNAFGDKLEKVWNWCDVLILPNLSENFGRVIAEALERGKKVITTDGAPAWAESLEFRVGSSGGVGELWQGYGGHMLYLKGYREGSRADRVYLLKESISSLVSCPMSSSNIPILGKRV